MEMETIPEDQPLPPHSSSCSACGDSVRDRSFVVRARRSNCVRSRFRRESPRELYHSSINQSDFLSSLDNLNKALQWPAWVRPIGLTVIVLCVAGWVLVGIGLANCSPSQNSTSMGNVMRYTDHDRFDDWDRRLHGHTSDIDDLFEELNESTLDMSNNGTFVNQTSPLASNNQTSSYKWSKKTQQGNDSDSYNSGDFPFANMSMRIADADQSIQSANSSLASLLYYGLSVFGMALIMALVALWSSVRVMKQSLLAAIVVENEKSNDETMKSSFRFSVAACSLLRGVVLRVHLGAPADPTIVSETFIDKVRSIENDQAALKLALATLSPSAALSLSPNPPSYSEIESADPDKHVDMDDVKSPDASPQYSPPLKPICSPELPTRSLSLRSTKQNVEKVEQVDIQRILQEQAQEIIEMKRELARMREAYARDPHEVVLNVQESESSEGPIVIMSGQRISGATPE